MARRSAAPGFSSETRAQIMGQIGEHALPTKRTKNVLKMVSEPGWADEVQRRCSM
jgi:hypothetical protein